MSLRRKLKIIHKGNQSQIDASHIPEATMLMLEWDAKRPISMHFYEQFSKPAWAIACQQKGIYQIITEELVDFVAHLIKNQSAIEICCGNGVLGKSLNIPLIDRKVSEDPRAKAYYQAHETAGAKCNLHYPPDVINMTANAAFRHYEPDWVIGAWVTQKLMKGKIGMMYGPVEEEFVEKANYIHIGTSHLDIHTKKRINALPHNVIEAEWLVSRSTNEKPSQMRIWTKEILDWDAFPEHLEFDYYIA